jgi:hypothetical protein
MNREFGKVEWVQVAEQHQSKWPHVNFLFKFEDNFILNESDCEKFRARWLVKNAYECGFGKRVSCDFIEGDCGKIANYISKTGLELVTSESVKLSQVPISAPIGFRRLRTSKGFLPKIERSTGEYTGLILNNQNIEDLKKIPTNVLIESMAIHTNGELVENISFAEERKVETKVLSLVAPKPSKDFLVEKKQKDGFAEHGHASLYLSASLKDYDPLDNRVKVVNNYINLSVAH